MASIGIPMPQTGPDFPGRGLTRIVSPAQLVANDALKTAFPARDTQPEPQMTELAAHVRQRWTVMRNHRNSANSGAKASLNDRLMAATLAFNGEYDPSRLAEINKFGGSTVYARIIASKCRGATALLREVYLGPEKPWGLEATPQPMIPDNVTQDVSKLLELEVEGLMRSGEPVDQLAVLKRAESLMGSARMAAKKKAAEEAKEADDALNDLLVEGGWYESLAQFIIDLPLFPFACIKGPEVRMVWSVKWAEGKPQTTRVPRLFWYRVSPYDLYWGPGSSSVEDTEIIERKRYTRAGLVEIRDLPGYNTEAITAVLDQFGRGGLHDWMDSTDQSRAKAEGRENPVMNQSQNIEAAEYHGSVQARTLFEYGFTPEQLQTQRPDDEVNIQCWLIDRWVIKVQLSPSPRKRLPYYITSYEKVPGTIAGNALPEILSDLQDVSNACLRALVNNLSIASGPQVEIQLDRLAPNSNWQDLHPWKRWPVLADPVVGTTEKPAIKFYQPESRAAELLGVYKEMSVIGDELSAIPKYITGSDRLGGAGRTASGLAMLMGNANKVLQTVASNIDIDVIQPSMQGLYDMVMIANAGVTLRGDENIRVRGVAMAQKREMERQRQMEFLAATANPVDLQLVGMTGRAKILREVASQLGLADNILPDEATMSQILGPQGQPGVPPPVPPQAIKPGAASPSGGQQAAPAQAQGPALNLVQPGGAGPGAGTAQPPG